MAQLERSFEEEAARERRRREHLRRSAAQRARARRKARTEQSQNLRFVVLLVSITLTVVGVSYAMLQTLAWLMG